jgi:predicted dinucleotide-binding enzyme
MTSLHVGPIAILGSGNVGQALAAGWRRGGHVVRFGIREPRGADEKSVAEAVASAGVIVLAVPYTALDDVLATAGDWEGKLVIDCTNPLAMQDGRLALAVGFAQSGAEQLATKLPMARVVKTLNQTGAENLAAAHSYPVPPLMFVAGDDPSAVRDASALVADLGFEPVHAGPLTNARLLEPLAMLWIDQALYRGAGRDFAFVRARRES